VEAYSWKELEQTLTPSRLAHFAVDDAHTLTAELRERPSAKLAFLVLRAYQAVGDMQGWSSVSGEGGRWLSGEIAFAEVQSGNLRNVRRAIEHIDRFESDRFEARALILAQLGLASWKPSAEVRCLCEWMTTFPDSIPQPLAELRKNLILFNA
jgi:hypothetical protein